MVVPEIKWIGSLDHDDLDTWRPENDAWELRLRMLISPHGSEGEESFDVTVCSIAMLMERARETPMWGDGSIFVEFFNWNQVRKLVESRVLRCCGSSWSEVTAKLSKFRVWEFAA